MSEARELFERAAKDIYQRAVRVEDDPSRTTMADRLIASIEARVMRNFSGALATALATEPGAVPELPEYMVGPDHRGDYWMTMPDGTRHLIRSVPGYDGYAARMAEAWSAIAARERARRAQS